MSEDFEKEASEFIDATAEHIPDRLSVYKSSKYYRPVIDSNNINIFLDGVKQSYVIAYCISEHWVMRYKRDKMGLLKVHKDGSYISEIAQGTVRVERAA